MRFQPPMVFFRQDELFQHVVLGFAAARGLNLIGRLIRIRRGQKIGVECLELDEIRAGVRGCIDKLKRGRHIAVMVNPRFRDDCNQLRHVGHPRDAINVALLGRLTSLSSISRAFARSPATGLFAVHRQIGHQRQQGRT